MMVTKHSSKLNKVYPGTKEERLKNIIQEAFKEVYKKESRAKKKLLIFPYDY